MLTSSLKKGWPSVTTKFFAFINKYMIIPLNKHRSLLYNFQCSGNMFFFLLIRVTTSGPSNIKVFQSFHWLRRSKMHLNISIGLDIVVVSTSGQGTPTAKFPAFLISRNIISTPTGPGTNCFDTEFKIPDNCSFMHTSLSSSIWGVLSDIPTKLQVLRSVLGSNLFCPYKNIEIR